MTTVDLPRDEAAQVRALTAGLGLPGLIDVHTHFMPDQVLRKVWAYFDAAGPKVGRAWPIAYRTSEAERVATLRDFGVLRYASLNYPHKPGMAAWLNEWSADFAAAQPDCLHSATFYPEPGATEYVERALARGASIFKAHVQVGNYDPTDRMLDGVWNALQHSRTPVVIHAGSGPAPGDFTGPARVRAVLDRFPELTLVIAHMGMPDYGDFLDITAEHERVFLDTTMAFTDFTEAETPFPSDRLDDLVELGDRVLFGSDFPNIPYPYAHQLEALARLDLGDEWMRTVLWHNGARLLGLDQHAAGAAAATNH